MSPLNQPTPLHILLDLDLYRKLPSLAWWAGVIYIGLAALNGLFLPPEQLATAVASLLVGAHLFLCYFLLVSDRIPLRHTHPFAAVGMAIPMLSESLLHVWWTADPVPSIGLIILVMGMGYFLLKQSWLTLCLLYTLIPWLFIAHSQQWAQNWVTFAVAFGATAIGTLFIQHTNSQTLGRFYLLQTQELLQRNDLQRRAERLGTAVQIAQQINATLDLPQMLQQVAGALSTHYATDYVGIYLLDEEAGEVEYRAGTYLSDIQYRQSLQDGLIGWAVRHQKMVCVNDVTQDPRYLPFPWTPDVQAELVIPLRTGHKRLGALDVQSRQRHAFQAEEIGYITLLADQIAVAIGNAILYQKEQQARQVADALRQVGQELNRSLEIEKVLDLVVGYLMDLVHTTRISVIFKQPTGLFMMALRGKHYEPVQLPSPVPDYFASSGIFQTIFEGKQPLHLPDVAEWPRWVKRPNAPAHHTWLGVPIINAGEAMGMLSLTREVVRPFTAEEIDLTLLLADQAAVALQNAQLYQQVVRFSEQMEEEVQKRTAEISRAYAELEQLDHAKDSYIRVLAHELRTPLTGLQNYTQLLVRETIAIPSPRIQRIIQGLQTGIQRLHQMADALNDIMRLDSGTLAMTPVIFTPLELLADVVEQMQTQLASREQTAVLSPTLTNLPQLTADYNLLTKLFLHLLSNAIKYTPNGGTITLHGQRKTCPTSGRDGVELCVEDTGVGIPPTSSKPSSTNSTKRAMFPCTAPTTPNSKGAGRAWGYPLPKASPTPTAANYGPPAPATTKSPSPVAASTSGSPLVSAEC
jgi:GAF domain-containing protein